MCHQCGTPAHRRRISTKKFRELPTTIDGTIPNVAARAPTTKKFYQPEKT
jgi:hypothetical protein